MTTRSLRRRALVALACAATGAATLVAVPAPAGASRSGTAPICSQPEGNARFVRFVYFSILGRCPDPSGLAHWTAKLDAGMSRYAVTEAIDVSLENLGKNNADELYQSFLGRLPTGAERSAVVSYIRAKHQDGPIVAKLVSSDEFYDAMEAPAPTSPTKAFDTKADHDRAWIETAYNIIVDHGADSGGANYWMGRFGPDGSSAAERYTMAYDLEHTRANATGWTQAVYFAGLHRPPDPAGLNYWINWLLGKGKWQTFRLWTHTLSSDEAYRLAQTQPSPEDEMVEKRMANPSHFQAAD